MSWWPQPAVQVTCLCRHSAAAAAAAAAILLHPCCSMYAQDESPGLPAPIQANISSGLIHLWGLDVPLPIRGTGYFEVVYLDDRLRVFRSGGALAVQVKQHYLQEQGLI